MHTLDIVEENYQGITKEFKLDLKTYNVKLDESLILEQELLRTLFKIGFKKAIELGEKTFVDFFGTQWDPKLKVEHNKHNKHNIGSDDSIKFKDNPFKWFINLFKRKREVYLIESQGYINGLLKRSLLSKILSLSNVIAVASRRGSANNIMVNTKLGAIIQDLNGFAFLRQDHFSRSDLGYPIGILNGIKVYVNPYMEWNDTRVLLWKSSEDKLDPGLVLLYSDDKPEEVIDNMQRKLKVKYAIAEQGSHANNVFGLCARFNGA